MLMKDTQICFHILELGIKILFAKRTLPQKKREKKKKFRDD